MKVNLVCKGGGIKGIALVGAISYLEEKGYEWGSLAGTSVGAFISALLAVGYTSEELRNILYDMDYSMFRDKNKLARIPIIGELVSVLFNKGIYSGNYIEDFMYEKLEKKEKTKFKHITINGVSNLKIVVSDITKKQLIVIPDDLGIYNIDPTEFDIAKAVRMSTSIPFIFNPIKINYDENTVYVVDGGVISNFPIGIFDTNDEPKWPTFGLNLINEGQERFKSTGPVSYMIDVIETSIFTNECAFFREEDFIRIINIPTLNIQANDFNITKEQKNALYESGYNSAKRFLDEWDFEKYKRYASRYKNMSRK